MDRRKMWDFFVGALTLSFFTMKAEAQPRAVTYIVPGGVTSIRVRSYVNDKIVIDTVLDVEPGQVFRITGMQEG